MKITAKIKAFPKISAKIKELKIPLSGGYEEGYKEGYAAGQEKTASELLGGKW